ncbi:UDP-3-O-(3-hydroxymyristoyl)glucosamine N-acyltransferase [Dendrosporobacter sp. 1207_IL3150]|uniref:UDP-3-O-(3-hydroxymyristoyl)glucosamine N-acyltransferase n=1 Tax=Dendrosporobacter sp. 1207_IL3150 TaxID=3084054 RepID=UPI002FDAA7CD
MNKRLKEIAELVDGVVLGDGDTEISGVTNIEDAGIKDITFAVPPHLDKAANSQAAAVIIPDTIYDFPKPAIRAANPRAAFTKLLEIFTPPVTIKREIHPTAVIGMNVKLGENVAILPYAVIADNVSIGDNTIIYSHSYIGQDAVIGSDSLIYPNVTIREYCHIGSRVIIHSGAVVGSDGFGFITAQGRHHKVPQVGNVVIEDDVEIGANTAIDRATTGSTVVRNGTKIDNFVHLAHNVVMGENCLLVAFTGIAGSVKAGNNVTFAGQSGSVGHITIGDNCVFAARSAPIGDVPAGSFYAGFPAKPHKEWLRTEASVNKLPDLLKKVRELEKRLAEVEGKK